MCFLHFSPWLWQALCVFFPLSSCGFIECSHLIKSERILFWRRLGYLQWEVEVRESTGNFTFLSLFPLYKVNSSHHTVDRVVRNGPQQTFHCWTNYRSTSRRISYSKLNHSCSKSRFPTCSIAHLGEIQMHVWNSITTAAQGLLEKPPPQSPERVGSLWGALPAASASLPAVTQLLCPSNFHTSASGSLQRGKLTWVLGCYCG